MKLYQFFGVNIDYFQKIEKPEANRQIFIYNLLAIMLIVLCLISALSTLISTLLIFQNWILGICLALLTFIVIWNLYNLIVVISLVPSNEELFKQWTNFEKYLDHYLKDEKLELTNLQINKIVQQNKEKLRNSRNKKNTPNFKLSYFFRDAMILSVILIIAIFSANSIQLFIFKNEINQLINDIIIQNGPNDPTIEIFFKQDPERQFVMINSYSILFDIELLNKSMGYWKYLSDTFFFLLYFTPYVLVKKSKEITDGAYLRESVLHEISINFTSELLTRKKIKEIEYEMVKDWDDEKYHPVIINEKQ